MKTIFSSETNGEWRLVLESESPPEGVELRRLFDAQPKGLSCSIDQRKDADGTHSSRLIIYSPRLGQK